MTTVELRTSIAAELDQMSVEMLESVSRYVSRLRRRARPSRRVSSVQDRREAAMLFVKNLSVQGGLPVPSDESGIDITRCQARCDTMFISRKSILTKMTMTT